MLKDISVKQVQISEEAKPSDSQEPDKEEQKEQKAPELPANQSPRVNNKSSDEEMIDSTDKKVKDPPQRESVTYWKHCGQVWKLDERCRKCYVTLDLITNIESALVEVPANSNPAGESLPFWKCIKCNYTN